LTKHRSVALGRRLRPLPDLVGAYTDAQFRTLSVLSEGLSIAKAQGKYPFSTVRRARPRCRPGCVA